MILIRKKSVKFYQQYDLDSDFYFTAVVKLEVTCTSIFVTKSQKLYHHRRFGIRKLY